MTHESGTLPAEGVRTMFDRIAPVYDLMNRVMTAGLDQRWRRLTVGAVVAPGDRVLDACCGTGDLAVAARKAGADVVGLDFSAADARARAAQGSRDRVDPGRPAGAAVRGRVVRCRDGRLRRPQRRRSRAGAGRAAAGAAPGRPGRNPRDHPAARAATALLPPLVRRARSPWRARSFQVARPTRTSPRASAAFPGPKSWPG